MWWIALYLPQWPLEALGAPRPDAVEEAGGLVCVGAAAAQAGVRPGMGRAAAELCLPGLKLRLTNRIPLARGLGSSAAAVVAGLLAAERLHENLSLALLRLLFYGRLQICEIQSLRAEHEHNPVWDGRGKRQLAKQRIGRPFFARHMVEPVDNNDCSDPVAVEAFTSLPHQDAELFAALMQRVTAKTKSNQTAVAQLRADVG